MTSKDSEQDMHTRWRVIFERLNGELYCDEIGISTHDTGADTMHKLKNEYKSQTGLWTAVLMATVLLRKPVLELVKLTSVWPIHNLSYIVCSSLRSYHRKAWSPRSFPASSMLALESVTRISPKHFIGLHLYLPQ